MFKLISVTRDKASPIHSPPTPTEVTPHPFLLRQDEYGSREHSLPSSARPQGQKLQADHQRHLWHSAHTEKEESRQLLQEVEDFGWWLSEKSFLTHAQLWIHRCLRLLWTITNCSTFISMYSCYMPVFGHLNFEVVLLGPKIFLCLDRQSLGHKIIGSQNGWVERDLKDHFIPTLCRA